VTNGWSSQASTLIVITDITGYSGLFFYSPSIGPGNLVGSWSVNAGTDPYGNPYPAGLNIQSGPGSIVINGQGGEVQEFFFTGNPATKALPCFIAAEPIGSGTAEIDQFLVQGAANTTHPEYALLAMTSNNTAGTSPAKMFFTYVSEAGAGENYAILSAAGFIVSAGQITGIKPGTGTVTTPAVAETWHAAVPAAGWTATGAANPARFRLEPQGSGGGCVRLDGELLTTGAGPWPANTDVFSLATGYMPEANHFFVTRSDIALGAGQSTVSVLSSGGVQNGEPFTGAGQRLYFDGVVFPLD
jgi:hypothetical protein